MVDCIEHRYYALFKERVDEFRIYTLGIHISHISVVDILTKAFYIHRCTFLGLDDIAVSSSKTYGIAAFSLQQGSDVLVTPSGIHHSDNLQCLLIGHPTSFHHLRHHAHSLLHLACHHSAAMHQDLHPRHRREILDKLPQQLGIVHHITTYLNYLYHSYVKRN